MSQTVRIFIDERPVDVPFGTPIRSVLAARDTTVAAALDAGSAYLTDGVGRRISPDAPTRQGEIYRVVRSARGSSSAS